LQPTGAAAGRTSERATAPAPPPNSLLDAVKRLSDLSSQLSADSEAGGGRQ